MPTLKLALALIWALSVLIGLPTVLSQTFVDEGGPMTIGIVHPISSDNVLLLTENLVRIPDGWLYDLTDADDDTVYCLDENFTQVWQFPTVDSKYLLKVFHKRSIGPQIEVVAIDRRVLGGVKRFMLENGQPVKIDSLISDKFIATRVTTRIVRDGMLYTVGVNYNNPTSMQEVWLEVIDFNNVTKLKVKISSDTTFLRSLPTGLVIGDRTATLSWIQQFPGRNFTVNFAEVDKITGEVIFSANLGDSSVYDYYDAKLIVDSISNLVFVQSACWNRLLGKYGLATWSYSPITMSLVDSTVYVWPRALQVVPWALFATAEGFASTGWYADLTFPGPKQVENSQRGLLLQFDHYGRMVSNHSLLNRRPTIVTSAVQTSGGFAATFKDDLNGPFIGYLDLVTSTEGPIEDSDAEGCGPTEIIAWDCVDVLGRRVSANSNQPTYCHGVCIHGKVFNKQCLSTR